MNKILYNILRKVKAMGKKNTNVPKKCNAKCVTCQFYNKSTDFCAEREIENCTKQPNTDFSKCDDYLVKESLIMF